MKKALAILLAFALVGVFAFADVADIAVEGNATLTWGYNLNTEAHGFNNAAEWKISIPLMAKQTFGTKSEGDNYAEINIKDAVFMIEGDHDGDTGFTAGDKKIDSMNATLHFGDVYMTVYDKPGFTVNNANIFDPIKADSYSDSVEYGLLKFEPGFDGWGTKVGYKTDKFDVAAKIGSMVKENYVGGTKDSKKDTSKYGFGVDVSATPSEMVEASATFNYATWARTNIADDDAEAKDGIMSLGFKVVAKPVTDLEITVAMDAGNDYIVMNDEGKNVDVFAWDAVASAKFKFVEAGTYVAAPGTNFAGWKVDGVKVSRVMDLALYAKVTDGDFVENLDAWATVMAYHLLSDTGVDVLPMAIGTGANYKYAMNDVNYVKPFASLYVQNHYYSSTVKAEAEKFAHSAELGVEYGLFTNTMITAKYATGSTNDNQQNPLKLINVASKADKGTFTLACKVTY